MDEEDFRETGAELYGEGRLARIQDAAFDPGKQRPWRLGWQDEDEQIAMMTLPAEQSYRRKKPE